jgi:hypothetical protein
MSRSSIDQPSPPVRSTEPSRSADGPRPSPATGIQVPNPPEAENCPWPRVGLLLLITAVVTWSAGAVYSLKGNPEIRFFKAAAQIKQVWAQKITTEHGAKVVFFGGSSCTFSVDPERLLKRHSLPAVNAGLGAGMGLRVLTRFALAQVADGDTLIMAMEPTILKEPIEDTMLGAQISYALHHPEWLARGRSVDSSTDVPWVSSALMLRPGGYHVFTLLGKALSRKPLYRYHASDFNTAGWQQTVVRIPLLPWTAEDQPISDPVRNYLVALRQWCEAHHVKIAYSLPWTYTDQEHQAELRRNNLRFLRQVATILPVLADPRLGIDMVKEHFADTVWHLAGVAAQTRTDELADQVKSWKVWSAGDLDAQ